MITSAGKRNPANPRRVTSSRSGQLGEADLTGASLNQADLTGARLVNANLAGAQLVRANLADAQLGGTNLAMAKNLTQQQLDSARGDDQTRLPAGLQRPAHWSAGPAAPPAADP